MTFFLSFGKGLNEAAGTQKFLEGMEAIRDILNSVAATAEKIGEAIANTFSYATPVLHQFWGVLKDIWGLVTDLLTLLTGELAAAFGARAKEFNGLFADTARELVEITYVISSIVNGLRYLADTIESVDKKVKQLRQRAIGREDVPFTGTFGADGKIDYGSQMKADESPGAKLAQRDRDTIEARKKSLADIDAINDEHKKKEDRTLSAKTAPGESTFRADEQRAKDFLALQKSYDKMRLDAKELDIQREKELDEEAYRTGEERLQEHIARQRTLNEQDRNTKKERAYLDYVNQLNEIDTEEKLKLGQALVTPDKKKGYTGPLRE